MSIVSSQAVGRQATNNAFISKLSYATDSDYQNAQPAFLVNFPDTSRAHIYYNTTLKLFRYHDGINWVSLADTGANITQGTSLPVTAKLGDIFIYTGNTALVAGLNTLYPNSVYYYTGASWLEFTRSNGMTVLGQTSGQVITNAVTTIINYNIQNNFFGGAVTSLGAGSYRPIKYGKYSISVGAGIPSALMIDVIMGIRIYINGVAQRNLGVFQDRRGASVAVQPYVNGSDVYVLSPTDVITIRVSQTTGANRALIASANEVYATINFLGV